MDDAEREPWRDNHQNALTMLSMIRVPAGLILQA
jgi:hypothetical protein